MPTYRRSSPSVARREGARAAEQRSTAPRAPLVRPVTLSGLDEGTATDLRAGAYADLTRFASAELAGTDLSGIELVECEVTDVRADGARLISSRLSQCRLERVSAAELATQRSTWHEVTVISSRIGAMSAFDAGWRQVVLAASRVSHLDLSRANLLDVILRDCVIDSLDLTGATLSRVAFEDTRIGTLTLGAARLADVDLRGAVLENVSDVAGLRGATVSSEQVAALAPAMAAHLGLRVL